MKTRRQFVVQSSAALVAARAAHAAGSNILSQSVASAKRNQIVTSAVRRETTVLRLGGGGSVGPVTWTSNGTQFITVGDSIGWPAGSNDNRSCQLWSLSGEPQGVKIKPISDYPYMPDFDMLKKRTMPYYGSGILSVGNRVYQYLSSSNAYGSYPQEGFGSPPEFHFDCIKLIYSPDNGRSWRNQDGTAPVRQEKYAQQSASTMVFFKEPSDAFSQLAFLQMGRGYEDNRDGYVYAYSPNGSADGLANQLVMFRVAKDRVVDRNAYEYFESRSGNDSARWTKDINSRGVVHTFPTGWVMKYFPVAWFPSVIYDAALGIYVMCNSGSKGVGITGVDAPSYLGIWTSANPWGPWTQSLEETAWMPANNCAARANAPQILPKWLSPDGRSFWIAWSENQPTDRSVKVGSAEDDSVNHPQGSAKDYNEVRDRWQKTHRYYSFNAQRVDLIAR